MRRPADKDERAGDAFKDEGKSKKASKRLEDMDAVRPKETRGAGAMRLADMLAGCWSCAQADMT